MDETEERFGLLIGQYVCVAVATSYAAKPYGETGRTASVQTAITVSSYCQRFGQMCFKFPICAFIVYFLHKSTTSPSQREYFI